jgi:hypothetical protein
MVVLMVVDDPVSTHSGAVLEATHSTTEDELHMSRKMQDLGKLVQEQEAKANELCEHAKEQAIDRAGDASEEKRHSVLQEVEEYCSKVKGIVTAEIRQDVADVGGKQFAFAFQSPKHAAKKEQALFHKVLGKHVQLTGRKAHKAAKDEAAAHEMKGMAKRALQKDQMKADTACAKAMAMALKKRHEKRDAALLAARAYCKNVRHVVQDEAKTISNDVTAAADGKQDMPGVDSKPSVVSGVARKAAMGVVVEAQAACSNAMDKVQSLHANPMVKAKALKMAQALCDRMKGIQQAAASAATGAEAGDESSDEESSDDDDDAAPDVSRLDKVVHSKSRSSHPEVTASSAIGRMPAKVVAEVKADVASVDESEAHNQRKAKRLCDMAKRKVRDDDGSSTRATRAHSMKIALSFCTTVKSAITKEDATDEGQFARLATKEGQKYGLKVVKLGASSQKLQGPTAGKDQANRKTIRKEKALFKHAMGQQAKYATDKDGLHEAMREVEHQALAKQAGQITARVKARLVREDGKAQSLCNMAKAKVLSLEGKENALQREAHLQQAVLFCKNAKRIVRQEEQNDRETLKRVGEEEERWKTKHPVIKQAATSTTQSVATGSHYAKNMEGAVESHAVSMCKAMKAKVYEMNPSKRRKFLPEAKQFCKRAKMLVAREAKLDRAALKATKVGRHRLRLKDQGMHAKARKLLEEADATHEAAKLHQEHMQQIEARRKSIKARAQSSIEKRAYEREQAIAQGMMRKLKVRQAKIAADRKNLGKKQRKNTAKILAHSKECKKILKNLRAMNLQVATLTTILDELEL